MTEVVGVRFKQAALLYFFDPAGLELEEGDSVVVETARGLALGWVVIPPREAREGEGTEPLKRAVRKAEPDDLQKMAELRAKEPEALEKCLQMLERLHLPMKMLAAEYNLEGNYLTFFFKAERRVDFRALLRELAATFKVRVELRQIGARDVAKLVGGYGRCGRPLCCASHIVRFETVSMRMAKEQNLPLNPAKISGVCGRLLCCLGFESEQYRELKEKLPKMGQMVNTAFGPGKVLATNPLKETILVELESLAPVEVPLCQITAPENPQPLGRPTPDFPPIEDH